MTYCPLDSAHGGRMHVAWKQHTQIRTVIERLYVGDLRGHQHYLHVVHRQAAVAEIHISRKDPELVPGTSLEVETSGYQLSVYQFLGIMYNVSPPSQVIAMDSSGSKVSFVAGSSGSTGNEALTVTFTPFGAACS